MFEKKATWVFEEGIKPWVYHKVPMHEPFEFMCSRGGNRTNEKILYDFKRSMEYMRFLKTKGNTQVWFNWWKGYGMQHESRHQEAVISLIPEIKEMGLRPILYVSLGSLTLDTLLLEEPSANDWVAKTQSGSFASCQVSHQCFRKRPCYTSEEYLIYMEKMLKHAMGTGADGIHFDNIGMQAEPEACHCDRCQSKFREYLAENYSGKRGFALFGWNDFSQTSIPWFNQHNSANSLFELKVPLQRAWSDFKVHVYSTAAKRLFKAIREVKADAFIEMNAVEADGFANSFWRAVSYEDLFPHLEMVCDEANGKKEGLNEKGAIIGPIRAKKWARAYGCAHNANGSVRNQALNFSDDKAFFSCDPKFWERYQKYQLRSESCARIAVLRDRKSLSYNRMDPWVETLAIEQYLIEKQLPFDLIGNQHLFSLDKRYQILIIAGMEIIDDETRGLLLKWTKEGGSLFLIGKTGMFNEDYLLRTQEVEEIKTIEEFEEAEKLKNAFYELIGDDPFATNEEHYGQYHQGRFAWLKTLDVDRLKKHPDNWVIPSSMLMLPSNHQQITNAMHHLKVNEGALKIKTSQKVYAHHSRRKDTGEEMIHLINYEYPNVMAQAEITFDCDRPVESVTVVSLDAVDQNFEGMHQPYELKESCLHLFVDGIKNHQTIVISYA